MPLRTGVEIRHTGAGAGSSAGAGTEPHRRRNNHKWADDQYNTIKEHSEGSPARPRSEAGDSTPQTTHQARTPRQEYGAQLVAVLVVR